MTEPLFPRPIAHRGLHNKANGVIENSASAFAAAVAGNFAIECDVQLSSDGLPVVFHDDTMERLLGIPGRVADTPLAQITAAPLIGSASGDRPQRLEEFLEQIGGRTMLQIELKQQRDEAGTRTLADRVARVLKTYQGPVTVESFDPRPLIAIRGFGFAGPRGIITHDYSERDGDGLTPQQRYMLRHLLHWFETRFDFISCSKSALAMPAIVFWRALGVPVTAWTIRSQVEAEAVAPHIDQIVFEGFDPDLAQ